MSNRESDKPNAKADTVVDIDAYRGRSVTDQAADWVARLRSPDAGITDQADFAQWLAASETHKAAFDEMSLIWALSEAPASKPQFAPQPAYRLLPALSSAAAVLVVCATLILGLAPVRFATETGEQHRVVLEDGSTSMLNTATEIEVDLGPRLRRIELHRGEAWFDVAHDATAPFVVKTESATVTAVGTSFAVRAAASSGHARVSVTEGRVRIDTESGESQLLTAGESATLDAHGISTLALDSGALAWRSGQLIYNDVRLDSMLDDINRYIPQTIIVNDDAMKERRVSAVLQLEDQEAMLDALGLALSVNWSAVSESLVILTPKP